MISNAQADKKLIDKAHQGDVAAMVRLGECYENGAGVQHDSTLALQWFRKAADLGDGEAWLRISKYYLRGTLVPKDTARYFAIRKEWADKGLPNGLAALGACYENGIGCKVDTAKANQLYQESVKKGSSWGYFSLGDNYYYGICGVKEDMKKAVAYYEKALKLGETDAAVRLARYYAYKGDIKKAWKYVKEGMKWGLTVGRAPHTEIYPVAGRTILHVPLQPRSARQCQGNALLAAGRCLWQFALSVAPRPLSVRTRAVPRRHSSFP